MYAPLDCGVVEVFASVVAYSLGVFRHRSVDRATLHWMSVAAPRKNQEKGRNRQCPKFVRNPPCLLHAWHYPALLSQFNRP